MHVTMVKKQLADGRACDKCVQAEELLKRRGLWDRIDDVVWAVEDEPTSPGMQLAARHAVETAPFFVVRDGASGSADVLYRSVLDLIKRELNGAAPAPAAGSNANDVDAAISRLAHAAPEEILRWGLERYGMDLGIAFSGAEDVVLIDMAHRSGLPFSVFCLDTGRLHPETYRYIEKVREHYGIEIAMLFPNALQVEDLVRKKGLYSFRRDGHAECCGIRKVEPLGRALATLSAWATGQRRDQSPTRSELATVERDDGHIGKSGPVVKLNPLAHASSEQVWAYIREHEVPYNELHEHGFRSIGCEPCTRAVLPGEHERAGRWWWEEATKRECGLHVREH
jgi:phosphoadenosine phosphosulfate reductase